MIFKLLFNFNRVASKLYGVNDTIIKFVFVLYCFVIDLLTIEKVYVEGAFKNLIKTKFLSGII